MKYYIDQGDTPNIVDVRATKDFEEGHIPGAINIPEEQWKTGKGFSKKKVNVVYCYTALCHLATNAAQRFSAKGYPVIELEGGMEGWRQYGYDVEQGAKVQFDEQAARQRKAA